MKQEDKQLLLQDLCARLPYGVKVATTNPAVEFGVMSGISIKSKISVSTKDADIVFECTEVKPYLRPISSMTEEEVDNLFHILKINEKDAKEWLKVNDIGIIRLFTEEGKDFYEIAEAIDYLNSVHIDYRELIEKGLAIEVTKENNPYK